MCFKLNSILEKLFIDLVFLEMIVLKWFLNLDGMELFYQLIKDKCYQNVHQVGHKHCRIIDKFLRLNY